VKEEQLLFNKQRLSNAT